jgi:hypothetical protein
MTSIGSAPGAETIVPLVVDRARGSGATLRLLHEHLFRRAGLPVLFYHPGQGPD